MRLQEAQRSMGRIPNMLAFGTARNKKPDNKACGRLLKRPFKMVLEYKNAQIAIESCIMQLFHIKTKKSFLLVFTSYFGLLTI